jgi:predicted ATPase
MRPAGNPLFVEQMVAMLVDEGHTDFKDGTATWIGGPPANIQWTMPPSVSALLAARIDRLNDNERAIVGCAAVIGTVFYAGRRWRWRWLAGMAPLTMWRRNR